MDQQYLYWQQTIQKWPVSILISYRIFIIGYSVIFKIEEKTPAGDLIFEYTGYVDSYGKFGIGWCSEDTEDEAKKVADRFLEVNIGKIQDSSFLEFLKMMR